MSNKQRLTLLVGMMIVALAAGAILLGELVDFRTVLSAFLVLGGVAYSVIAERPTQRTKSSSGS